MDISITLDEEQTDALDSLRAAFDDSLTAEEYLAQVLVDIVNAEVSRQFTLVANDLVAGAKALPYASRVALIAQVQSQLPTP